MPKPARIHIDLETLSTRPDAAVISIGAALFLPDATQPHSQLHERIDFSDAMRHGRADGDTIAWWFKQSDEARSAALSAPIDLCDALGRLHYWAASWIAHFEQTGQPFDIMANGPAFDCIILHRLFHRVLKHPAPWKYWQERDYRTLRGQLKATLQRLGGDTTEPERIGAHNALMDATHQGRVIAILEARLDAALDRIGSIVARAEAGEVAA